MFELEENRRLNNLEFILEVIYEDDYLAIIDKPPGILVSGNKLKTIVNALPFNLQVSSQIDALINPLPVHRLDFPTSGLLLIAKTNNALVALGKMFEEKKISKIYHAITIGQMKPEGADEVSKGNQRETFAPGNTN